MNEKNVALFLNCMQIIFKSHVKRPCIVYFTFNVYLNLNEMQNIMGKIDDKIRQQLDYDFSFFDINLVYIENRYYIFNLNLQTYR